MAEETKTETKKAAVDYIEKIGGTLTLSRAEEIFGKSKAIAAMHAFAAAGGHGLFDEAELRSPLFGGLMLPNPPPSPSAEELANVAELKAKINAALAGFEVK